MDPVDDAAIRNLIARVAWLTDTWSTTEEYVVNYTDDATWQILGTGEVYRGHDGLKSRLMEMLALGVCGPGLPARHLVGSLEIVPGGGSDGAGPLARAFVTTLTMKDSKPSFSYGEYHDTLRKVGEHWLIHERLINTVSGWRP
ncbi:nuclear transport factor 2 family protein [Hydrogenophaga sp.]|uniref:nuclear transport factor 2 family protein n=1 Tax=Hydrogenophaga sp. TaxID=1904254 RepID=UPI00271D3B72|nr:nuclear transport factor 2 family protein [Hydrogenophaga sp.]MDO9435916.1 nuclear transport factor 2 family protein [Hydrogenophaga sp.]